MKKLIPLLVFALLHVAARAQTVEPADTAGGEMPGVQRLSEVTVSAHRSGRSRSSGLANAETISSAELLRAACCNLGESFTTNPSVDVNYADAATGARQIRLLGLSGTYVQMLTENIPNIRGLASPYALGYIPGPWMQSIQVSKGASSVKNGYESITGQINVEFKKPQATPFADANIYYDSDRKLEANLGANLQLKGRWSTALLGHYELLDRAHDDNDDGFADMPKVRQGSLMSRWAWMGDRYIFQAAVKGLKEHREGGQNAMHHGAHANPYLIDITNERYEAFAKNAFIIDADHMTNVALILSGTVHHERSSYGQRRYDASQRNGYASLMFETDAGEHHSLSAGLSLNHDHYDDGTGEENTPGAYAQYTYKIGEQLTLMGGLRWDHSSLWGSFVTPRMHVRYAPTEALTLRASAGKGYRTPHVLAENTWLLASSRQLAIASDIGQEEAWNTGASASLTLPLGDRRLELNAEYYYTRFVQQAVVDFDGWGVIAVHGLADGDKSYSHTVQVDATTEVLPRLTVTAAWRMNDVRATYDGRLRQKPLSSRYKGLLTASYAPGLGLWQMDATFQLNGGGRMPDNHGTGPWPDRFRAYGLLSAQLTRFFRHWSIYAGGENLTGFRQRDTIIGAADPWGPGFDATMVWGPVHGAMVYIGARLNWNKL